MYKIKYLKKKNKIKTSIPPKFNSKQEELLWYRKQKMKSQLFQIKYVSIQYKDIMLMKYDENKRLRDFYMKTNFGEINELDRYVQISKFKDSQDVIIALILNSYWLVNKDELDNKNEDEIYQESFKIEEEINYLNSLQSTEQIKNRITLLEYKLNTIKQFLNKNKVLTLS